ncbi:UDP-N-acetylmuramoyl-L-alanyl-D-glutamate--2,6-diaminopimelate ligase [Meiothermus sp. PNK-Is4]|nr:MULTISPECIES: UDP-N-acetylmuramoyl-L-alanyl-D-glutamate--2,6-diaminopimelate ligase [unclassified Meiothermus]PZA06540.1 UDP-N-acetylmuramoyl-L-alanyl-D-glutamate--2,6-diaminopimelate ligase [Meiothermus sp. Pnk-1]RYM37216.1 UDP-N-acetylmuramoyl-L-alanyl-D-glutamate--2,6-diaminopimelate ligase [Meiothermus sp. PNK-Is4]
MPYLDVLFGPGYPTTPVSGVTHDSRLVEPGFVFVAIEGLPSANRPPLNGHDFIPEAIARGAVGIVGTQDLKLPVPYLKVADARQALADLSAAFWEYPAKKLQLVGVTGTKGKTTVTVLTHHLLQFASPPAGRISTVGVRIGEEELFLRGHFTTPEAPQVQEMLARFVAAGCKRAVLEVSSHALVLERVRGLGYEVGVWTNLSPDHLDFHGSMERYFAAKQTLLRRSRFGVLNREDPYYPQLPGLAHWSYGTGGDWQAEDLLETAAGLHFRVRSPLGVFKVSLPMIGKFNALNALAAMAAAARLEVKIPELQAGLEFFPGVPGRMQIVQATPFRVIVDFAHTASSVRAALETLRPTTRGRLVIVVGAAGERGAERRTGIGQAAGELADFAVFTEEDHRSENLEAILQTMAEAAKAVGGRYALIPDRREAIRWAIAHAEPGDTLLLAGKGHERTLERGHEVLPWNEVEEARKALGL